MKVYVLIASVMYEGSEVAGVFADKENAEGLASLATEYLDAGVRRYDKAWKAAHPIPECYYADYFEVEEFEVIG